jgi:hypothetical protein
MAAKLNLNERKVLRRLAREFGYDAPYFPFGPLMRATGLTRKEVRRACRSLTRKGLAQFGRGLWDDDGHPAGSGYAATFAGAELAEGREAPAISEAA